MSPCAPLSTSAITPPPSNSSGFAPNTPALNTPFPPLPFEDLGSVFDALSLILPSGTLKPPLSANFDKDLLDGISHLMKQFTPFFMAYTFFLPILNLLTCIIEVLCAIPNPFKLISAMTRLFRVCIPEFLSLFPIFAIPIMVISLLLLILTLINYILQRLLTIIELIINNVETLSQAAARNDTDSVLSITKKIGDLLCLLQNLFVAFGVIGLIIQVIESVLKLAFQIPPCDDSSSTCCTPDVCPSFIRDNDAITGSTGFLQYFNEVGLDSGISLPPGFPPIFNSLRSESWQFYDPTLTGTQQIDNITHQQDLPDGYTPTIFFPTTSTFNSTTPSSQAPYTVDLRLFYNPIFFGRSDVLGARYLRVTGAVVLAPPVDGVSDYKNNLQSPFNGTAFLSSGSAFEDDGTTVMKVSPSDSSQATLNTLIHLDSEITPFPVLLPTDGYLFSDITYSFNINHAVLLGESLITTGCVPTVSLNKNIINSTFSVPPFNITLPDINGAKDCVFQAISAYKQNISIETTQQLQATITACLNTLTNDTVSSLVQSIIGGYNQYKSIFTLNPSIQFTTYPIKLEVQLNDANGNSLTTNLPSTVASQLIPHLKADINFGAIDTFVYDGYQLFTANITSSIPGNGKVKVAFDNKFISTLTNPTNLNDPPVIAITELPYTFVLTSPLRNIARRDVSDIPGEEV